MRTPASPPPHSITRMRAPRAAHLTALRRREPRNNIRRAPRRWQRRKTVAGRHPATCLLCAPLAPLCCRAWAELAAWRAASTARKASTPSWGKWRARGRPLLRLLLLCAFFHHTAANDSSLTSTYRRGAGKTAHLALAATLCASYCDSHLLPSLNVAEG